MLPRRRLPSRLYSKQLRHACPVHTPCEMVDPAGLAPATFRVRAGCSTKLSYESFKMKLVSPPGFAPGFPVRETSVLLIDDRDIWKEIGGARRACSPDDQDGRPIRFQNGSGTLVRFIPQLELVKKLAGYGGHAPQTTEWASNPHSKRFRRACPVHIPW